MRWKCAAAPIAWPEKTNRLSISILFGPGFLWNHFKFILHQLPPRLAVVGGAQHDVVSPRLQRARKKYIQWLVRRRRIHCSAGDNFRSLAQLHENRALPRNAVPRHLEMQWIAFVQLRPRRPGRALERVGLTHRPRRLERGNYRNILVADYHQTEHRQSTG